MFKELLGQHASSWNEYRKFAARGDWQARLLSGNRRTTNYLDFLGLDSRIDKVLDETLGREDIQSFLMSVLGPEYRIWYCQIRRVELDSRPLRIHQDLQGELGMSILLSDVTTNHGTTVLIRGSHRWPRIINAFPFLSPRIFSHWTTSALGNAGDVYFFYNDTWHGNMTADQTPATAIILTFLPKNRTQKHRVPPTELLEQLGPNLVNALSGKNANYQDFPVVGPDSVISRTIPVPRWHSLWGPLIGMAAISRFLLKLYRKFRGSRAE